MLCVCGVCVRVAAGDHGSTFSGGPLICSAASVVVRELTRPDLLANVQARSQQLMDGLKQIQRKTKAGNKHGQTTQHGEREGSANARVSCVSCSSCVLLC